MMHFKCDFLSIEYVLFEHSFLEYLYLNHPVLLIVGIFFIVSILSKYLNAFREVVSEEYFSIPSIFVISLVLPFQVLILTAKHISRRLLRI